MRNQAKLKRALAEAASRVREDCRHQGDYDLLGATESAYILFSDPNDILRPVGKGRGKVNLTRAALRKTNRLMRRKGISMASFDFQGLIDWIVENWAEILKVIMSLLIFI